ncbi:MAG: rod shape-determining protein MreC [Desulfarculales bacterium]|nr:rod shape-determining protein MreC [Desulfarculales bacterium]
MDFFRRYRFIIITVIFLVAALTVFSINANQDPRETISGRLVLELVGPLQSLVSSVGGFISGLWNDYFALVQAARQNRELKFQLDLLSQRMVDYEEIKLENGRLQKLLALRQESDPPQTAAQVVGWDPSGNFRTAIINKGTNHGVEPQMAVVNSQGVVGRIIWASPNYAKVLLLLDPNAAIDVLVQRSRARGIVEGAGSDSLRLKYIVRAEEIIPGDIIIASGDEGVFPKGMLVGTVRAIHPELAVIFLPVELAPAVDFERLEEVSVILRRRVLD